AGLSRENQSALPLLQRFGDMLQSQPAPRTRVDLLTRYASSDLAAASYPVSLAAWAPRGTGPIATFSTTPLQLTPDTMRSLVARARREGRSIVQSVPSDTTML